MPDHTSLWGGKIVVPGYQLKQLRGRGTYGSVWEVEKDDGTLLALKFLPAQDSSSAVREIRAIQLVQPLRHPNLTRIDQVWALQGYVVLTMELAEGSLWDLHELHQLETGKPIDRREVCRLLSQAAAGLDFLNTRQHLVNGQRIALQHCDIKPSNLLLFGNTVKLCDFGLSSSTSSTVKFHRRAGTLDYTAPEVFLGQLSDWTDQYALAITYFQLRTGKFPFPDAPKDFDVNYVRPEPDLNMLTPSERPILLRGLARTPQSRWPSCGEFMTQLYRLLG